MARKALDAIAEQLKSELALDAVRSGDRSEGDAALAAVSSWQRLGLFAFGRRSLLGHFLNNHFGFCGRLCSRSLDFLGDHSLGLLLVGLDLSRSRSRLGRFGFLRRALLETLLGLLARLSLLRVVARRTLADAGGIEEAQDSVRGLGSHSKPMLDAVRVELHALGRILCQERIVGADLLDEAAITSVAAVGDNDPVIRALLGAAARKTNCNCHNNFLS